MIAMFIWTAGDLVSALFFVVLVGWFIGSLLKVLIVATWECLRDKFRRPTPKDQESKGA